MPKRVLVISHFFPPHGGGGVHRVLAWTRHLPAFGWNVTVLAAGRDGYWIHDDSLLARVPPGTEVLRVGAATGVVLWRRLLGGGIKSGTGGARRDDGLRALSRFFLFPDSYAAWGRPAVDAGLRRVQAGGIDAVISTSPPETAHLVGERVAGALPWVADFRDPWVALHYRKPPTPWHAARHRAAEKRVFERAARVLAASRTHYEALAREVGDRAVFLPNGIELADAEATTPKRDERLTIVSTGSHVDMPALFSLFEALARKKPAGVRFVLAGPHDAELERVARGLPVEFAGILPHAEARALQRSADRLLFVRNEGPGYDAMVPGKTYEYLDARRPVVAMVAPGEAASLLAEGGARVFGPTQGDEALDALLAGSTPNGEAIDRILAGRSRRALAGRLAEVLDGLA
jgi:glycosyltransferase involved in cell wall biosynthesis